MFSTPRSSRLQIGIFGRRNVGKSSLINAMTSQEVALVSATPGTTTDPVYKSMELLPFGPVVFIDTPGIDDEGELGTKRVEASKRVINQVDLAIIVTEAALGISSWEQHLIDEVKQRGLRAVLVINKIDSAACPALPEIGVPVVAVSAKDRRHIDELRDLLSDLAPSTFWDDRPIVGDLLQPGDQVVMIVPIDKAAPKGRLILPQVQVLRDILDHGGSTVVVRDTEAETTLQNLASKPKMVVTDSQVFAKAAAVTAPDVWLTSFSILFARHKGDLGTLVEGTRAIAKLRPGDRVLIAEACTHRRQHEDIGQIKIPGWLNRQVGGELSYEWVSGNHFPDNLSNYQLIVHCGACMINRRAMISRLQNAVQSGVPMVNYGVLIAYLQGIFPRALQPFGVTL